MNLTNHEIISKKLVPKFGDKWTERIASIDIETVRLVEHYDDLPEDGKTAWEYKNKQDNIIPPYETLTELWDRSASLYPEFSKIVAVSIAFERDGKMRCKNISSTDESELLEELGTTLDNLYDSGFLLMGHSAKYFDFSFLRKRYVISNIHLPEILDDTGKKPWEVEFLDTNELWKGSSTGPGSSLVALCFALGVPLSKDGIDGSMVGKEYYSGNLDKIAKYCGQDAVATFNILKRYINQKIYQFDEVEYINAIISTSNELEKLLNNKKLTPKLKKHIESKELTEKDKKNLSKLLVAAITESGGKAKYQENINKVEGFLNSLK